MDRKLHQVILELERGILVMLLRAQQAATSAEAAEYAEAASKLVTALSHATRINLGEIEGQES